MEWCSENSNGKPGSVYKSLVYPCRHQIAKLKGTSLANCIFDISTGYVPSSSTIYMTAASTLVSAAYSGKTLAEFSPSSVVMPGIDSSSAATTPIESSTTSSTDEATTKSPTEPAENAAYSGKTLAEFSPSSVVMPGIDSSSAATTPIESSTTSSTDEATTKSPTEPAEKVWCGTRNDFFFFSHFVHFPFPPSPPPPTISLSLFKERLTTQQDVAG